MDDIFKKEPSKGEPQEPLTPVSEPEEPSKGEPQGNLPPKEQEGTPQWYKSQLDKMQNEYKNILAERETNWSQEKEDLSNKISLLMENMEGLKNPPSKPEEPPQMPNISEDENPLAWIKYFKDLNIYNSKNNPMKNEIESLKTQFQKEQDAKKANEQYQLWKSDLIGQFEQRGLSHTEAIDCFNRFSQKGSINPDNFVALYKLSAGQTPPKNPKEEKETFPLPVGAGGGANVKQSDAEGFINSIGQNKFKDIFKKT
jgi:hypothetical protein